MRRAAAAAVLLGLASLQAAAAPDPVADKPSIIAVGDGLTESAFSSAQMGWGLLMQEKYVRKADVLNRGFGGFFTPWMVDYMLPSLFDAANPTMAVIFLGVKDSLTQAVSGDHYVSPQQFGANVDRIIQAAKAAGVQHFALITPPPVCEACKGKTPKPWDRENSHTLLYVEQLEALARKHGAGLVDIFRAWQREPGWDAKYLLPDKLHLSPAGNAAVFSALMATIAKAVPAMDPAALPVHYPLMTAINKDDPGAAFSRVARGGGAPPGGSKSLAESGLASAASSVGSSGDGVGATIPAVQQPAAASAVVSSAGDVTGARVLLQASAVLLGALLFV